MQAVFVYGSLKPGYPFYNNLRPYVNDYKAACMNGTLYCVGQVPAMRTLPNTNTIKGFVLYLHDSAMPLLDHIEGHPRLYKRIKTTTTDGEQVWTYVWPSPISEKLQIKHGIYELIKININGKKYTAIPLESQSENGERIVYANERIYRIKTTHE